MGKKGQVTMFIILGMILLIIIALVLFGRNYAGIFISGDKFLSLKSESVEEDIRNCIVEEGNIMLDTVGKQGGSLDPELYRYYNGSRVQYLCTDIPNDKKCANNMFMLSDLEREIAESLRLNILNCVETEKIAEKAFYEVETGDMSVNVDILDKKVVVDVDYPVTLIKKDSEIILEEFKEEINVPLGEIYDHVHEIVEGEANQGVFYYLPYMLGKYGKVEIQLKKPYPDKLYIVNMRNSPYIFQFFVGDEPWR
jgi:hypothetical protein